MKITRNNYEPYFLDYLEGTLDESLVDEFLEFLQNNPDLKSELKMAGSVKMKVEEIFFEKKNNLYKEKYDLENEFNRAAIARLEGDLSEKEQTDFEKWLSTHPEKQKEPALFEKTKLKADETIVYPGKNSLYHHPAGKTILLWATRAAAILLLGFLVFRIADNFIPNTTEPATKVAQTEQKSPISSTDSSGISEQDEKIQEPTSSMKNTSPEKTQTGTEPPSAKNRNKTTPVNKNTETIAETRIPVEVPEKLNRINMSLSVEQPASKSLAHMEIKFPEMTTPQSEERLLADVVKEKTGIRKLSVNKVAKVGLNLVSSISKENFDYETNEEGKITELNYDSRLLAFTIPTKNE